MKKKLSFMKASRNCLPERLVCDASVDPNPKCEAWGHYKYARQGKERLLGTLHREPVDTRTLFEKCMAAESSASSVKIPIRFEPADFFFIPGHQIGKAVLLARLYGKVLKNKDDRHTVLVL